MAALRMAASEGKKGEKLVGVVAVTALSGAAATYLDGSVADNNSDRGSAEETRQCASNKPTCSLACGLVAGALSAGMFNPIDRALYLSVKERRAFLLADNFRRPYQGFLQTVGGRTVQGGAFFPLEHMCKGAMSDSVSPVAANFAAGSMAGAVSAVALNPMSAIKYRTWGRDDALTRGLLSEARDMFRRGGFRPFFNGMLPTVIRDVIFGGTYTVLRRQAHEHLPSEMHWVGNMCAAGVATIISGPLNLARNMQFAAGPSETRQSIVQVLMSLKNEIAAERGPLKKLSHVQGRLRVGWGTARVAVGMAFGNHVYDSCAAKFCDC